ncbi:MAG: ribokinase [Brevinema sp.]
MKNVLVIGSVNVDFIVFGDRIPSYGETVIMKSYYKNIGGKGFNQAMVIKNLGINTQFQGSIGDDDLGIFIQKELKKNKFIGTKIQKNSDSGIVFIGVDKLGQNTIMSCPNSNLSLSIDDISQHLFDWADIIILQQEIDYQTVKDILNKAKSLGKLTVFNAAPAYPIDYIDPKCVDYLIVNEQEFAVITNSTYVDINKIPVLLEELSNKGYKNIILTNGGKGVFYYFSGQYGFIKSHKVDVVNTVGAGDTFIGAWVASYINHRNPVSALHYANAVAALKISQKKESKDICISEKQINALILLEDE